MFFGGQQQTVVGFGQILPNCHSHVLEVFASRQGAILVPNSRLTRGKGLYPPGFVEVLSLAFPARSGRGRRP